MPRRRERTARRIPGTVNRTGRCRAAGSARRRRHARTGSRISPRVQCTRQRPPGAPNADSPGALVGAPAGRRTRSTSTSPTASTRSNSSTCSGGRGGDARQLPDAVGGTSRSTTPLWSSSGRGPRASREARATRRSMRETAAADDRRLRNGAVRPVVLRLAGPGTEGCPPRRPRRPELAAEPATRVVRAPGAKRPVRQAAWAEETALGAWPRRPLGDRPESAAPTARMACATRQPARSCAMCPGDSRLVVASTPTLPSRPSISARWTASPREETPSFR